MITNEEKIQFIQDFISGLNYSIGILEQDIIDNPNGDVEEKPTRQYVLNDLILQKSALLNEIETLS